MKRTLLNFAKNNFTTILEYTSKGLMYIKTTFSSKATKTKDFVTEDIEHTPIKESRWKTWFPFSFFYGNGRFQPLYYFAWLFSHIGAGLLILKGYGVWLRIKTGTFEPEDISTADIATVLGFVGTIITIYTVNRNTNKKYKEKNGEFIEESHEDDDEEETPIIDRGN